MTKQRRSKRPLSRNAILKAAVSVADKQGLAKVSMRNLAQKLGVEAMSLYNHVENKDDILDGIVDLIFKDIDWPDDSDWKLSMRQRAISTREVLKKHRWAVSLLDSRPNPGPMTLKYHDRVLGCFKRAGFPLSLAGHAFSSLDSYTYGFIMQEQALPFETPKELKVIADAILNNFPRDAYPNLFEFTSDYILQPGYSFSDEFLFGLDLLLDGLDRKFKKFKQ